MAQRKRRWSSATLADAERPPGSGEPDRSEEAFAASEVALAPARRLFGWKGVLFALGLLATLDVVLALQRRVLAALAQRRELLHSRPKDVTLLNDTAWLLATDPNRSVRNGPEALELAQRAIELSDGKRPEILGTLAAAYAETGQFAEVVQTARKALVLAA